MPLHTRCCAMWALAFHEDPLHPWRVQVIEIEAEVAASCRWLEAAWPCISTVPKLVRCGAQSMAHRAQGLASPAAPSPFPLLNVTVDIVGCRWISLDVTGCFRVWTHSVSGEYSCLHKYNERSYARHGSARTSTLQLIDTQL